MARRISWTNNSSGHIGTHVYRGTDIDPDNLPEPVATVDPVAQGETSEWVDAQDFAACYAVRDYYGHDLGALSSEVCVAGIEPFDPTSEIGDYTGGGIYAGIYNGSHLIMAAADGAADGLPYKNTDGATAGTSSTTDGWANTQSIIAAGIAGHPSAQHCVNYRGGAHEDWYLPASGEWLHICGNILSHPELETVVTTDQRAWGSNSSDGHFSSAATIWVAESFLQNRSAKTATENSGVPMHTRPVRRVSV